MDLEVSRGRFLHWETPTGQADRQLLLTRDGQMPHPLDVSGLFCSLCMLATADQLCTVLPVEHGECAGPLCSMRFQPNTV